MKSVFQFAGWEISTLVFWQTVGTFIIITHPVCVFVFVFVYLAAVWYIHYSPHFNWTFNFWYLKCANRPKCAHENSFEQTVDGEQMNAACPLCWQLVPYQNHTIPNQTKPIAIPNHTKPIPKSHHTIPNQYQNHTIPYQTYSNTKAPPTTPLCWQPGLNWWLLEWLPGCSLLIPPSRTSDGL